MFTGQLGFLSNFDTTSFFISQLSTDVPSGEHAFNALKTLCDTERRHVLAAPTPGESKRRGRHVTLQPDWNTGVRVWAMQRVFMAKVSVPAGQKRETIMPESLPRDVHFTTRFTVTDQHLALAALDAHRVRRLDRVRSARGRPQAPLRQQQRLSLPGRDPRYRARRRRGRQHIFSDAQIEQLERIHHEMTVVLQILMTNPRDPPQHLPSGPIYTTCSHGSPRQPGRTSIPAPGESKER